jgi:hypothetical protein
VVDSEPALVTTRLLPQRNPAEDDGSFGHAVAETAKQTRGLPPLRWAVAVLALAAALLALVALWWQSVGARMWRLRRRNVQPRLMIDIPLASDREASELAMGALTLGRDESWGEPGSSRLGDRAAAE